MQTILPNRDTEKKTVPLKNSVSSGEERHTLRELKSLAWVSSFLLQNEGWRLCPAQPQADNWQKERGKEKRSKTGGGGQML